MYFDSAATSLKPRAVIEAISQHLSSSVCNVHRAAHALSVDVSERFERARATIARSIGAESSELVFTYNSSYALLMLAEHLRASRKRAFVTSFEHHSNLVPWKQRYATTILPCDRYGRLHLDSQELAQLDSDSVVSIAHASNVTGVVQPVRELSAICRQRGALLVVDGAQSFPHLPIDVSNLGCDFFVFSPHKAFGPSGLGVVYGRRSRWQAIKPLWLGGGTLDKYSLESGFAPRPPPQRFELGTPNIEGVLGTAVAVEFLEQLDRAKVASEADRMYREIAEPLMDNPRVRVLGGLTQDPYIGLVTISVRGIEPEHLATVLSDRYRVLVRSGFHCSHPLYTSLGVAGGVRFSGYVYNTFEECERVASIIAELGS